MTMGVFDAASAAITGALDWSQVYGFLDDLDERVRAVPDMALCGNGLLVEKHLHFPRSELEAMLAEARQYVDKANQLCVRVLEGLP